MEKIIHKLINEFTEGVDTYTHNNSTWLIFTETKQWVIELTENKTLWYNYNFFKSVFAYTSLDCVQNQHLITKWVEDNIINKELIYSTLYLLARDRKQQFEDTLKNGVKETKISPTHTEYGDWLDGDERLGEIIKNGVKKLVEDTIQNGVKKTDPLYFHRPFLVKDTDNGSSDKKLGDINDIIQNGVKEIYEYKGFRGDVKDVIQDGVRDTQYSEYENQSWINGVIKKGVKDTLKNGVKETKQKKNSFLVLDTSGRELILESHLVVRDGVRSSTPRQYVGENIIDKIINKNKLETKMVPIFDFEIPTELIENVIDDGNKVCGTYVGGHRQEEKSEIVIEYGKQI